MVLRILVSAALSLLALPALAMEGLPALHQQLTLVVDSEQPISADSLNAMRIELNRIFRRTPMRVEVKDRKDLRPGTDVPDLVYFRVKGDCRVRPTDPVYLDERGPLGLTYLNDGEMTSFGEVRCDKVRAAARSAMWGGDYARAAELMGRALARVMAHEVFHMVARETQHSHEGVFKRSLTGKQLIQDTLELQNQDSERLGPAPRTHD